MDFHEQNIPKNILREMKIELNENSSLYSGSICGVVGTTPPVATGKEEEEAEGGKRLCDLPVSLCKNRESYSIKSIVIGYHLGTVFFCKFAHLKSPGIQGFLESSLKGREICNENQVCHGCGKSVGKYYEIYHENRVPLHYYCSLLCIHTAATPQNNMC